MSASHGSIPKLVRDINNHNFFTGQRRLSHRRSQEGHKVLSDEPSQSPTHDESHDRQSTALKTLNKTPSLCHSAMQPSPSDARRAPEYKPIKG